MLRKWCPEVESNHRHKDFQSFALPTELSGLRIKIYVLLIENLKNEDKIEHLQLQKDELQFENVQINHL